MGESKRQQVNDYRRKSRAVVNAASLNHVPEVASFHGYTGIDPLSIECYEVLYRHIQLSHICHTIPDFDQFFFNDYWQCMNVFLT